MNRKQLTAIGAIVLFGLNPPLTALSAPPTAGAKPATAAIKTSGIEPATVDAAAKVIDLRRLELPDKAIVPDARQVGELTYEVPADLKAAFEFHRSQLAKAGWKELPGTMVDASYANGMFSKSGYTLNVSTSTNGRDGAEAGSRVSVFNFGNIVPAAVPIVSGTKSVFANEATSMSTTDLSVADATKQIFDLLKQNGWQAYGREDVSADQQHFSMRKNAIRASLMISKAPAQNDKTSIMVSTILMAAELPAPEDVRELRFDGQNKVLRYSTPAGFEDIGQFYVDELAVSGWKPTTPEPATMQDEFHRPIAMQVFRNTAEDIISLDMAKHEEEVNVTVRHQTRQELEDTTNREREAAKRLLAQRADDEKAAEQQRREAKMEFEKSSAEFDALAGSLIADALSGAGGKAKRSKADPAAPAAEASSDAIAIRVPTGTVAKSSAGNVLKVTVNAGKGKSTAEFIAGHLKADGWECDDEDLDASSGNLTFSRDEASITLTYADPGPIKVMMMLIGVGVELAAEESDAAAKSPAAAGK